MFCIETIKQMNAAEVRKRAAAARKKASPVSALVRRADEFIAAAADAGKTSLDENPLAGLRMMITDEQAESVWANLRSRGFKVSIRGKQFRIQW